MSDRDLKDLTIPEMDVDDIRNWILSPVGLGFCGCGQLDMALRLLRDVLTEIGKRGDDEDVWRQSVATVDVMLAAETHPGLYYSYLYWLDSKGLIEHGSGVGGSWLTEDGSDLLAALDRYGIDALCN